MFHSTRTLEQPKKIADARFELNWRKGLLFCAEHNWVVAFLATREYFWTKGTNGFKKRKDNWDQCLEVFLSAVLKTGAFSSAVTLISSLQYVLLGVFLVPLLKSFILVEGQIWGYLSLVCFVVFHSWSTSSRKRIWGISVVQVWFVPVPSLLCSLMCLPSVPNIVTSLWAVLFFLLYLFHFQSKTWCFRKNKVSHGTWSVVNSLHLSWFCDLQEGEKEIKNALWLWMLQMR